MALTSHVPTALQEFLSSVEDPRTNTWLLIHPLENILLLTLLGVMSGAQDFTAIAAWAQMQKSWLSTLVDLHAGVPSHDTFARVFALLDAPAMEAAFLAFTQHLAGRVEGFVALDGKTARASRDPNTPAMHLLNAWASDNALILGQMRVEDKENEIVGLPRLIAALELRHCVVTIDAMGCQLAVAQALVDGGADYILRVKANHPTLLADLELAFESMMHPSSAQVAWEHVTCEEVDKDHGRLEIRRAWGSSHIRGIGSLERWPAVASIVRIESQVEKLSTGKVSREVKYFLSSLAVESSQDLEHVARGVRLHWGVENKVHWVLDVAMGEDRCRSRVGASGQVLSLWRKLALNLLRKDTSVKVGAKTKMLLAATSPEYLLNVLKES